MATIERLTEQQIDAFIRLLGYQMGPDWDYISALIHDGGHYRAGTLYHSAYQAEIGFSNGAYNSKPGTLHVYGIYPRDSRGQDHSSYHNAIDPSINVSITRGPEAVAADISRRFLPIYMERLSKCITAINETEAYIDHKSKVGRTLAAEFPQLTLTDHARGDQKNNYNRGDSVTLESRSNGLKSVNVEVSRGYPSPDRSVKITLDYLTVEEATRILDAAFLSPEPDHANGCVCADHSDDKE